MALSGRGRGGSEAGVEASKREEGGWGKRVGFKGRVEGRRARVGTGREGGDEEGRGRGGGVGREREREEGGKGGQGRRDVHAEGEACGGMVGGERRKERGGEVGAGAPVMLHEA